MKEGLLFFKGYLCISSTLRTQFIKEAHELQMLSEQCFRDIRNESHTELYCGHHQSTAQVREASQNSSQAAFNPKLLLRSSIFNGSLVNGSVGLRFKCS